MSGAKAVWQSLVAVDKLTVQVIVDNETDSISSPCCCCAPAQSGAEDTLQPVCKYTSEMMRVGSNGGLVDFNQMCYAGTREQHFYQACDHCGNGFRARYT